MAKKKTVKAEASKTPSLKTELVKVTNFDKTAEVTEVRKKKGTCGETPVKGREPKPSTEIAPVVSAEVRQVLRRVGAKMLTSAQIKGQCQFRAPMTKQSISP